MAFFRWPSEGGKGAGSCIVFPLSDQRGEMELRIFKYRVSVSMMGATIRAFT